MTTVLIVEDQPDLRDLVVHHIEAAGWTVVACGMGHEAVQLARQRQPDLVVLDVMLPDMSGIEVCRRLRAEVATSDVAVIMLTARGAESDRVAGFEAGADDYVPKPFSTRELMLRVRAVLRRRGLGPPPAPTPAPGLLHSAGISVDRARHRVEIDGHEVRVTALEFRLLVALLERPGEVLTRPHLLAQVWGVSPHLQTRTVDTHVKRLRERLGHRGEAISTVRGVGYRFDIAAVGS
ncbi:MAG: response regulator transcription factor [Myxococcales bacterium]|nr:response regulator transcription factor [Myxococcales bacterium]